MDNPHTLVALIGGYLVSLYKDIYISCLIGGNCKLHLRNDLNMSYTRFQAVLRIYLSKLFNSLYRSLRLLYGMFRKIFGVR